MLSDLTHINIALKMSGATTGLKMSEKSSNVLKTLSQIPKSGLLGGNSVKKRRGVSRLLHKTVYSKKLLCGSILCNIL